MVQRGATLAAVAANNRGKKRRNRESESVDGLGRGDTVRAEGRGKREQPIKQLTRARGIKKYPVNLFSTSASTTSRTTSFSDSSQPRWQLNERISVSRWLRFNAFVSNRSPYKGKYSRNR